MRLFINALWSPAGKRLTSWLSFVMSNCEVVTFPLVSWVRAGPRGVVYRGGGGGALSRQRLERSGASCERGGGGEYEWGLEPPPPPHWRGSGGAPPHFFYKIYVSENEF